MSRRVLIVGGMAGGASCAARLRRLDDRAEIVVFERSPWISVASCGLPYFAGGVIRDEAKLFAATPESLRHGFNIQVRTDTEVCSIDRSRRSIQVRDLRSGALCDEPYDALVLSPGAAPVRPAWPGIDLPGVFCLRTLQDVRAVASWIDEKRPARAVVVGAGLIGLEMAENLAARGMQVSIIEKLPQVAPMLDAEMSEPLLRALETNCVDVTLGEGAAGFETAAGGLVVHTWAGRRLEASLAVIAVGVTPDTALARAAGLEIGDLGGIRVDDSMRTSDASIWAVGDAVEVPHLVTGQLCLMPQAGPAVRQGRVAADSICGRASSFRGVQGTIAFRSFGVTAAVTGATEAALREAGVEDFEAVYLHPDDHAAFYPGGKPLHMKLIFAREDGRILGAQAVGESGAEKRIDVIALAIQKGGTIFDLEESELCYAPQFGSARDPVNLAGMVAANTLRGDMPVARWSELDASRALIIDVREPHEFAADHIEGAINVPLADLRERMPDLPACRPVWVYCGVGQRAYFAARVLLQNGFEVLNLSGGYRTYCGWYP